MILKTERLVLRRYRESDLEDLYAYLSDPEVVRFEPYKAMTKEETAAELADRIASPEMIAVEEKASRKLIGNVYLGKREFHALELGYVFHKAYWGRGYAAESCSALIDLAFSRGIHRVYAECAPQNVASWRLLERLGFEKEAHLRQNVYFWEDEQGNPIWKDTWVYARLNEKMILQTKRLLLREMTPEDFEALYAVLGDSDISEHYPYTFDEARVRNWIARNRERYEKDGFGLWAVVLKETGELIGDCGITLQCIHGTWLPEVGYHIRKDRQRNGYASEAAAGCVRWAFEHCEFPAVYSYMKYTNIPSQRTAMKNGMKFVEEYEDPDNQYTRVYVIHRKEWEACK